MKLSALPAQVDSYTNFIRHFVPETLSLTQSTAQTAALGWLGEFEVQDEPKPVALALLTKLETQVRQIEAKALMRQAMKIGAGDYFDRIGAFVIPASETVAPNAVYQAQLILSQSATSGRMHFRVDGREIATSPATQQGLVQFRVPAAQPGQPDTVRAQWHGRVQIRWRATDTVLETTVPYFIVKPSQH